MKGMVKTVRSRLAGQGSHQLVLPNALQQLKLLCIVVDVEVGDDLAVVTGALVDGSPVVSSRCLLLRREKAQVHLTRPQNL